MSEELTKEEVNQRARELARRVMSTPAQPQSWPKEAKPTTSPERAS